MADIKHPANLMAAAVVRRNLLGGPSPEQIADMLRRIPELEAEVTELRLDLEGARAQRDKFMAREASMGDRCDALEAANKAFSERQKWWNDRMFEIEAERDALHEARYREAAEMGLEIEELKADVQRLAKSEQALIGALESLLLASGDDQLLAAYKQARATLESAKGSQNA